MCSPAREFAITRHVRPLFSQLDSCRRTAEQLSLIGSTYGYRAAAHISSAGLRAAAHLFTCGRAQESDFSACDGARLFRAGAHVSANFARCKEKWGKKLRRDRDGA